MAGYDFSAMTRKVKKVKIGGIEFKVFQLRLCDFGALAGWAKENRRKRIREEAETIGGISKEMVFDKCCKPLSDEEFESELATIEGIGMMIQAGLKPGNPEIAFDNVMEMFDLEDMQKIIEIVAPPDMGKNLAGSIQQKPKAN